MKSRTRTLSFVLAYVLLVMVMFLLPAFSASDYSLVQNTTSQLGAQATPNAWIMNITFVALGLSSIVAGWKFLKNYWIQQIILVVFGFSLVMVAIYRHAPIDITVGYDNHQHRIHSLFASITGFSFTVFAFSMAFVFKHMYDRWIAMLVGIFAVLLSILMFSIADFAGIWQRMIFVMSFGWLIYIFSSKRKKKL
ncbi:DUF998 domain-containing protein [Fulvivirga sp. 29W222]|uniref:DUF998 domain-containing protein n=1 Tax=Fulvivirga marina TaxID=2494733 RepID=A0A937KF31_9BACT|nr:DUF998 domain-containing protein [Fulvivirga marina]MBL6447783.1 DUF998 domain-containing protein [Fulvivirga marina]